MSQQNISKSIRQLETELNIILFVRSNTGITLTNEGQIAYVYSKQILDNVSGLRKLASQAACSSVPVLPAGHLKMILSPGFLNIASNIMRIIDRSQHKITIYSTENEAADINKRLLADTLVDEICFTALDNQDFLRYDALLTAQYNIYLFSVEPLQLITSVYSSLSTAKSVDFKDLGDLPLIFYKSSTDNDSLWLQCLKRRGLRSRNIIKTGIVQLCADYLISDSAYSVATAFYY